MKAPSSASLINCSMHHLHKMKTTRKYSTVWFFNCSDSINQNHQFITADAACCPLQLSSDCFLFLKNTLIRANTASPVNFLDQLISIRLLRNIRVKGATQFKTFLLDSISYLFIRITPCQLRTLFSAILFRLYVSTIEAEIATIINSWKANSICSRSGNCCCRRFAPRNREMGW